MIRLDFNHQELFRSLSQARARLEDMKPIHDDIGEYMIEATKGRFRRGEAPDGTRWQPKKPATIERYRQRGDGDRPDPLIGPSKRLSSEISAFATRGGVEIGSALEYSAVMQHGAAKGAFGSDSAGRPLPWGTIPARVWLGLSDEDERNILDIVEEHLDGTLDG